MFKINDYILYDVTGVCKIESITEKSFPGFEPRTYYVVKPVYSNNSVIYAPVETATAKMRKVLSPEEAITIIKGMPDEEDIWIDNDNHRKELYSTIIKNGDRRELVKLIKTLYLKRTEILQNGRKVHAADEKFMKEAEKLLYEEFALVLNIDVNGVVQYISDALGTDVMPAN